MTIYRSTLEKKVTHISSNSGTTSIINDWRQNTYHRPSGPVGNFKTPNSHSIYGTKVTACSGRIRTWQPSFPSDYNAWSGVVGRLSHPFSGSNPPQHGFNITDSQCLNELNEAIRGSLDLSVDAFQARQTAQMVKPLNKLRDLAMNLRRGWRGTISQLSAYRLEWEYGWKPAMSSIYGVVEEMQRTSTGDGFDVRARSAYKEKDTPVEGYLAIPSVYCKLEPSGTSSWRTEIKVWMKVPMTASNVDRLTSLNPISIGYELIPYSFVLDWVWNLGGYLRDLESAFLYQAYFSHGYKTQSWKSAGNLNLRRASATPTNWSVSGTGTYDRFVRNRVRLTSFPFPSVPPMRVDLGAGRLLNLAALLGAKL